MMKPGEQIMASMLHLQTTVLPGHRLEISDPNLPDGASVAVTVHVREPSQPLPTSMLDLLASLPVGPRAFPTWEAYERHLREERDAWDRGNL
jgi:hypothetical protein